MTALLIVIYIAFVSLGFPDSLFGVSWPVVHVEFGTPESFASLYSIITGICTGGVSFIAGTLIRKFGTGKVTFFSTLLTALGLIGISFSPNIVVMMICTVIMGYGAGAIDTGLNNFVSLHYKAKHMNWLHCCWGLGVTVSPMIMSAFLGGDGTWRNGYRVVALLQFAIALIILASLKKWNIQPKNVAETENAQKDLPGKSLFDLLKIKGIKTSILSLGLYCGGEFLIGTWGATYAVNVLAVSPDEAAKWISLYFGGIMVGRIISGFLSEKLSDNTLIKGGMALAAVGMVILILPIGKTALVGLFLIGMGYGPVFPSVLHSVPARFGADYSADITGYHMGGAYGIGFFIQLIYGYVASATTFAITPFVLFALALGVIGATVITLKALKKASVKKPPEVTEISDKDKSSKNAIHMLDSATDNICNSFIITTEDGKLIVIDGGYESETENFLEKLKQISCKDRPHIDAWFLTHPHSDHVNCFFNVTENHADEVDVERIYCNFPSRGFFEGNDESAAETMDDFYRVLPSVAAKIRILCGGDILQIGSAKFYILYSQDFEIRNCNNSSLVFRMELGGKSVMFTGDSEEAAGEKILRLWKDSGLLDCDICQMSHHGQNGLGKEFYEAVSPEICLWPTPSWLWTNRLGTGPYKTLVTRGWMKELGVKKHYVMKDGVQVIEL